MPEPDEVAGGNPFEDPTGLPIRDVLAAVDVWQLEDASVGIAVDHEGTGATFPALHLALLEREPDDPAHPRREVVVIRFGLDDLALLLGQITAALKPEACRQLGLALLEGQQ